MTHSVRTRIHTAKLPVVFLMSALMLSSHGVRSAQAVQADGGYEGNVLPGAAGWTEQSATFLGDYVTVAEGVMTYDGKANTASGYAGMSPRKIPKLGNAGTIEYRVRCRAMGDNPKQSYQYFMTVSFAGQIASFSFCGDEIIHNSRGWNGILP